MNVKLLTENHLEILSLKGACRGSSESTPVEIPHCWKSHALAHLTLPGHNHFLFIVGCMDVTKRIRLFQG